MSINLKMPDITELKPRITVFGVGGAGCNAVNNMIEAGLQGVEFVVANTDAQALTISKADRVIQMGVAVTQGLGAGSQPEIGRAAAEETIDEITDHLNGAHMAFITAGMGGGTGTGAAPIVARAAREAGILTVGVVTKPFQFEGQRRMRVAEAGIIELQKHVDTLIVIPNQNLFRVANDKTTFADAFAMADEVLYSGVACITDLMVKDGLINLDFADVRSVMREMGKAMMGTGEASGDKRAIEAAEKAIANPLLDDVNMRGARGLLISITGGRDMTLFEVDEAASRVREEVDSDANIIFGATFDESLEGIIRVSVVATGIEEERVQEQIAPPTAGMAELTRRLKSVSPAAAPIPARRGRTGARRSRSAQRRRNYALEGLEQELAARRRRASSARPAPRRPLRARPSQPRAGDPGVRIGPFRPDPALVARQRRRSPSRSGCRKRCAPPPRRTSSRPWPSAPTTCSRACRGWRIFRPSPSGRSAPRAPRRAGRGGAPPARPARQDRKRPRPPRRRWRTTRRSTRTRRTHAAEPRVAAGPIRRSSRRRRRRSRRNSPSSRSRGGWASRRPPPARSIRAAARFRSIRIAKSTSRSRLSCVASRADAGGQRVDDKARRAQRAGLFRARPGAGYA